MHLRYSTGMSSSQYHPIPGEDGLSSNDIGNGASSSGRFANRARNESLYIAALKSAIILAASILIVVNIAYYVTKHDNRKELFIYETTAQLPATGLERVDVASLKQYIPNIRKLEFGNQYCGSHGLECIPQHGKIEIDSTVKYQTILGFGGAFTEVSADSYFKLPLALQQEVMDLFFGKNGIGLSLGKININSCTSSLGSYNFDNVDGDTELNFFDFDVTHDRLQIIPFILDAIDASKVAIKFIASPCSPPAWMKMPVNGSRSMQGSAKPAGLSSDPKIKWAWARYLSMFVQAYKSKGIKIWAITPQNEPEVVTATSESCLYSAEAESNFINGFLGPMLRSEHPDVAILGFDDNRNNLEEWTRTLLKNDQAGYIKGLAFHG